MADLVTIPEVYIKEEPVERDEEDATVVDELKDPFECESNGGFEGGSNVHHHEESREEEEEEPIAAAVNSTSVRGDSPPPPLPPPAEKLDENDEAAALVDTSASIFEPEVDIRSEEDDLHCDDLSDAESDDGSDNMGRRRRHGLPEDEDYEPSDEDRKPKKDPKNDGRERTHQCPICGKFFLTSSAMNGHVAKGHGTTLGLKFTCHVCGAPGSSRASLKRHLIRTHKIERVDHPELLTKKCTHCGIGFSSHLLLYEHIRASHSEKLQEYHNCTWCPALMRAKASLLRHIRRTHPDKEEPFQTSEKCPFCDEAFPTRLLLQRHLRDIHPDTPRHVCSVCNAGFKFPYMLTRHKVIHEDPKKYEEVRKKKKYSVVCEYCGRKFGSKPRLEYHVQVVHTNPPIKIYTCRLCGLTFPTAKQNNRHYRKIHRPERQKIHCGKCNITFSTPEECAQHRALHPNTCDVCQKQFLRRDSLREHLLIHSAPRHQCPHCSKKFTQRSNLKRHIRVHTGEKPYQCPFCQRNFSDKSACNSHVRVHTGYERSVCGVCGASFSKKQRLNYHMRIHTGEGLLYCPLCARPATNSYSLRKHIESHEQPLTKALTTVGFRPLLVSDPAFVSRALQALTQATLQTIDRHENVPNSFIDSRKNQPELLQEADLEDCSRRAFTSIAKIDSSKKVDSAEREVDASAGGGGGGGNPVGGGGGAGGGNFSLTKFLQGLLEQESQKVRTDRQDRRDRRLRSRALLAAQSAAMGGRPDGRLDGNDGYLDEDDEEEEEEDLPPTIGDELVRQCLEIIMKDEPHSEDNIIEDDDDECEDESPGGPPTPPPTIKKEREDEEEEETVVVVPFDNELVIKTEQHHLESDLEWEQSSGATPPRSPSHQQGTAQAPSLPPRSKTGIPKIKISRVTRTDAGNDEDLFVAEIIKKT